MVWLRLHFYLSDILVMIYLSELHEVSFLLQTEIAKRLNTILAQIMPFLSQEVRLFVVSFSFQSSHWLMRSYPLFIHRTKVKVDNLEFTELSPANSGVGSHIRGTMCHFSDRTNSLPLSETREEGSGLPLRQQWAAAASVPPCCIQLNSASLCFKFHT